MDHVVYFCDQPGKDKDKRNMCQILQQQSKEQEAEQKSKRPEKQPPTPTKGTNHIDLSYSANALKAISDLQLGSHT